jgi:hypothetical protein
VLDGSSVVSSAGNVGTEKTDRTVNERRELLKSALPLVLMTVTSRSVMAAGNRAMDTSCGSACPSGSITQRKPTQESDDEKGSPA